MDETVLSKITRLGQEYRRRKVKGRVKKRGPYWMGYWQEEGKVVRVYIGRVLPKELRCLLKGRFKRRGYRQYTWPGRRQ